MMGDNTRTYGAVTIGDDTIVGDNVVIGHPDDEMIQAYRREAFDEKILDSRHMSTSIGRGCIIKSGTIIYVGARVGSRVICGHSIIIGESSCLGDYTKVFDGSRIYAHVRIGRHARINGFCCDRSVIGDNVSMLGELVHKYPIPIGGVEEKAPVIEDNCVIGWGAIVIGDVVVHEGAYVGAGAIVTEDIPSYMYAVGIPARVMKRRDRIDLDRIRGS